MRSRERSRGRFRSPRSNAGSSSRNCPNPSLQPGAPAAPGRFVVGRDGAEGGVGAGVSPRRAAAAVCAVGGRVGAAQRGGGAGRVLRCGGSFGDGGGGAGGGADARVHAASGEPGPGVGSSASGGLLLSWGGCSCSSALGDPSPWCGRGVLACASRGSSDGSGSVGGGGAGGSAGEDDLLSEMGRAS